MADAPALQADLDEFTGEADALLDDGETPIPNEAPPADEAQAIRLYRRLARLKGEIATIEGIAKAERDRIAAWEADRTAGLRRHTVWLASQIEGWQRAVDRSTVTTPYGTSRLRPGRPHVEVADEAAFVKWALAAGYTGMLKISAARAEVAKMQPGPDVTIADGLPERRQLLVDEGEVVPGVFLVTPTEKGFTVS